MLVVLGAGIGIMSDTNNVGTYEPGEKTGEMMGVCVHEVITAPAR
jgi:hypothetical protein